MGGEPAWQALEAELAQDPLQPELWLELGDLHRRAGRRHRALRAYEQAAELQPQRALPLMRVGLLRFGLGLIREAEQPLRRALALEPGSIIATVSLATVLERSRRLDEALALLEPLAQAASPSAGVAMTWAGLQRRLHQPERALPVVRAALGGEHPAHQRALLLHALGDLLDDLGRWEQAFSAFDRANRGRGFAWDACAHRQRVDRLVDAFSAGALAGAPRASVDASRVVLIVGMPRSGTTLLEQVLCGHDQVSGVGELDTLRRVGQRISAALGTPGAWFHQPGSAPADLLDQGAGLYLGALEQRGGDTPRITDKMPDNFLQLGLAARMLPGCRVIHIQRDTVDTCWSCFRQPFGPGLGWACSLDDIAAYHADYRRIMDHWSTALDLPVLELRYEDLVGEPEPSLRRVFGFLELEHQPAHLDFHRSERLVSTASHAQVQQPLHRGAVGRSQPYRAWLGPLYSAGAGSGIVT